ncbi:carboxypeptidase regulatory-like domain-containing protein [Candidatus Peribacteria bacterium]|nr:carboxypeptidase regulatory-like domain-containing protein [Candidatus Peribacteria bacterium]
MNKKIYLILPVCLLVFSSCRFLGDKKDDRVEIVPSAGIFEESLQLDSDYIKKLRLHGYTNPGETSIYMQQKQDIVDAYKSGDRSINLLRAYAYLSAFEADFQTRDTIMEELCRKNTTTCDKFYTQVSASGVVRDSLGKPISEATVEVIGTAQKTTTDRRGRYSFQFRAIAPSVVRLRVTSDNHMIGVKKLEIVDAVRASDSVQSFERNFTLIVPYETVSLDTQSRTIE